MKNNIPWDLIISKFRQDLSKENEILFNEWLSIGNNQELFRQLEIVWKNVQLKSATYEPDVEYYWQKFLAHIQNNAPVKKEPRKVFLKYFSRIAAVAAILIITLLGTYYLINNSFHQKPTIYSTRSAKTTIFLPDSSEVILHANTALTCNFNTKSDQREVSMTGEAYFKVRHDDQKPFLVNANGVTIKVHGTEFNVSSYSSDNKILVSLIEGSVSMKTADEKIFLKPGEEGSYDKAEKTISVAKGDMDLAKIWTGDKIRFENKSLNEVCKYLSKWYGINIIIDPKIKGNQSYTFTVTGQPLTEIIEIMSSINSFDYYFTNENELILKQKK